MSTEGYAWSPLRGRHESVPADSRARGRVPEIAQKSLAHPTFITHLAHSTHLQCAVFVPHAMRRIWDPLPRSTQKLHYNWERKWTGWIHVISCAISWAKVGFTSACSLMILFAFPTFPENACNSKQFSTTVKKDRSQKFSFLNTSP